MVPPDPADRPRDDKTRRPPLLRGRLIFVPFDGPARTGRIRPGGPSSFPSPPRMSRLHLRPPGFPKEHAGHRNRLGVTAPILKNRDQPPSPTLLPPHDPHLPPPVAQAMKRSERVHDVSESALRQIEPEGPPCMGLRAHVLPGNFALVAFEGNGLALSKIRWFAFGGQSLAGAFGRNKPPRSAAEREGSDRNTPLAKGFAKGADQARKKGRILTALRGGRTGRPGSDVGEERAQTSRPSWGRPERPQ